jgi:hypothetical protein
MQSAARRSTRRNQRLSEVIRGNQTQSEVIRRNQTQSDAIGRNQTQSVAQEVIRHLEDELL